MTRAPASEQSSTFVPVSPEERLVVLDVLRGFALLGVAIMNMPAFSMPSDSWALEPRLFPGFADRAAEFFMTTFFAGKANSIFSLLFGLGLTIQMQRAEERGQRVAPMYLRRLLVLFLVGAAHAILIWNGDVLHSYAVVGLLLLAVRRASDRLIVGLIALSFILPRMRSGYALYTDEPPVYPLPVFVERAHESVRIFQHGTYAQQIASRLSQLAESYTVWAVRLWGPPMWWLNLTTTMLLGFYAGRHRLLSNVAVNAARVRKVMWWCLGLGLSAAAGAAVLILFQKPVTRPTIQGFFIGLLFGLNRPLLCIAYIGAIALLLQKKGWKRILVVFSSPGRMPMTNYLMQSILATTLFYSYGFGLFGQVGPFVGFFISVAMFVVQILYSKWWLARFQYGPFEWLWRAGAYGKLPPLRVNGRLAAVAPVPVRASSGVVDPPR
jgi:uncharacterized protein